MIKSITNFLIIFFIFQQLNSQISQIDQNGYNAFCDETLHMALVRGQLLPRQIRTGCFFLWTMINKARPSESGLFMLLHNTTAVFINTLGFMTFVSGTSEIVAKRGGGGRQFWQHPPTRELKMGCQSPLCVSKGITLPSEICSLLVNRQIIMN